MLCSKGTILTEPLKYLTKRANEKFPVKMRAYTEQMLIFTRRIDNGHSLDEKQKKNFTFIRNDQKNDLNTLQIIPIIQLLNVKAKSNAIKNMEKPMHALFI